MTGRMLRLKLLFYLFREFMGRLSCLDWLVFRWVRVLILLWDSWLLLRGCLDWVSLCLRIVRWVLLSLILGRLGLVMRLLCWCWMFVVLFRVDSGLGLLLRMVSRRLNRWCVRMRCLCLRLVVCFVRLFLWL